MSMVSVILCAPGMPTFTGMPLAGVAPNNSPLGVPGLRMPGQMPSCVVHVYNLNEEVGQR